MTYTEEFVAFLNKAITPFHAVEESRRQLKAAGFTELLEREEWALRQGGKYFFTRNMTSIVAFAVGQQYVAGNGFTVLGAHTDSPCFRTKPVSCAKKNGYLVINTAPYGGGLWHTWFDRDLGIAGRLLVQEGDKIVSKLVSIEEPVARIPNLAIHLQTDEEKKAFAPNTQEHCMAILTALDDSESKEEQTGAAARHDPYLLNMLAAAAGVEASAIVDAELQLVDTVPSTVSGSEGQFICSGRLDNLCSSFQLLRSLIDACQEDNLEPEPQVRMIALFDHEEIGSNSAMGAGSSLLPSTLRRVINAFTPEVDRFLPLTSSRSYIVSVDMAHAVHPNYAAKHDANHAPKLNGGFVVKHNPSVKYATNATTATIFRLLGERVGCNVQEFAVRSDSGCGSTIGPILSTLSGIRTVDVGTPQWSMHSIREVMGTHDGETGYRHLKSVLKHFAEVDASIHIDG